AAVIALAVSSALTMWAIGGRSGIVYTLLFAIIAAPGLPLGFALFGRHHAAGWIAGLLFGYSTMCFVWWAGVFSGLPSLFIFGASWCATALVLSAITWPFDTPFVALPGWTMSDTTALLLVLLMVPALVVRPFDRLGSVDAEGNRQYRAYFIAD